MSSFAGRSQHGELGAAGSGRSPSHSITLLIPQRSWRVWSFQPFSGTRWNCTGATARSAGRATKRSILQRSRTLRREGAVGPVRCAFTFDLLTRKARVFVMPTRSGRGLAGRVSARGRGRGDNYRVYFGRELAARTRHTSGIVCVRIRLRSLRLRSWLATRSPKKSSPDAAPHQLKTHVWPLSTITRPDPHPLAPNSTDSTIPFTTTPSHPPSPTPLHSQRVCQQRC